MGGKEINRKAIRLLSVKCQVTNVNTNMEHVAISLNEGIANLGFP